MQSDKTIDIVTNSLWVLNKGGIINKNKNGTIELGTTPDTMPKIYKSDNPLMLLTIHLQKLMGSAWIDQFNIHKYLEGADFGKVES